jgi:hypothetical protein
MSKYATANAAPTSAYPGPATSFDTTNIWGCLEEFEQLIARTESAEQAAKDFADTIGGREPEGKADRDSVRPVPSGYVDTLRDHLQRLSALLNGLAHHQGRINRALRG